MQRACNMTRSTPRASAVMRSAQPCGSTLPNDRSNHTAATLATGCLKPLASMVSVAGVRNGPDTAVWRLRFHENMAAHDVGHRHTELESGRPIPPPQTPPELNPRQTPRCRLRAPTARTNQITDPIRRSAIKILCGNSSALTANTRKHAIIIAVQTTTSLRKFNLLTD